jgi:integrase
MRFVSIYKRGKSWYYDFQSRGERYAGCIGVVSKTVAKEVLAKKKAEASEGRYVSSAKKPSPLLEEIAAEYLKYYRANRKPRSVERHEMAYKALSRELAGKRLSTITPLVLEQYKQTRKEQGRSEVTINRELAFLKNLFTMAIQWGRAHENPVKQVQMFREDNGRTRFLTNEEEVRLLSECGAHLRPVVIAAIHTGFRKSELLSLTWGNVNFRHQLVTVEAGYAKNSEARSVPMTSLLTETLKPIRINGDPKSSVFRNSAGKPYRNISTAFNSAVKRARITDFTFHDLRHTFASRLVMRGVDLTTVKELMGHKHINMTLRYAHLAPGHKRSAISVLDQTANQVPSIFPTVGQEAPTTSSQVIEK